jgi:hypothetical protein
MNRAAVPTHRAVRPSRAVAIPIPEGVSPSRSVAVPTLAAKLPDRRGAGRVAAADRSSDPLSMLHHQGEHTLSSQVEAMRESTAALARGHFAIWHARCGR